MAYRLKEIGIRTNNSEEGMKQIQELWQDVTSGKLPILFNSAHEFQAGISPVSKYCNYESDENGDYDFSILGVTSDFFEKMEHAVTQGVYRKYDTSDENGNLECAAQAAWAQVWSQQKSGQLKRAFTEDYESSVPAKYTKDGKAHCYLWIAV